ncbi:UDP-N-acetylenolpyruvoylglucosamine reductase [Burkholderia pseudomallei]|nr:UDP-N-acetylenolpyruvoylglucosamine reductase [Burkholderia pseudomallei]MPT74250.1 UDP-N-acetylenolpyruvoylglucosamine reductase [Burkholderia pseudomallei]MPT79618.1 UDP-N-acetylenolpyruvoylglucosamine reductase [Burkholderia pseudomallei]MPT82369.1 UDP-N-acetylenolpyruvoylglucosamine reductase [Burkholderia pseudomallei]MPT91173.1 UDP-N-acetylenolpyruvoylglucosamine reductase [Burkholderia pseudomallei]
MRRDALHRDGRAGSARDGRRPSADRPILTNRRKRSTFCRKLTSFRINFRL